jgi:hypothetical protein
VAYCLKLIRVSVSITTVNINKYHVRLHLNKNRNIIKKTRSRATRFFHMRCLIFYVTLFILGLKDVISKVVISKVFISIVGFTCPAVASNDSATFLFPVPVPTATILAVRTILSEKLDKFSDFSSKIRSRSSPGGGGSCHCYKTFFSCVTVVMPN